MIIGITGKSGSGKNHFAEQLLSIAPKMIHIDIDKIGHMTFEIPEVKSALIQTFGHLERKKIAEIIFNNRYMHDKLADITWKYMKDMIEAQLKDTSKGYILNWILLPSCHFFKLCDIKYLIKRDETVRVKSAMMRDSITIEQMAARDNNSIQYNEDDFDYIIINNS
jgi:dephospho-CoA kinase